MTRHSDLHSTSEAGMSLTEVLVAVFIMALAAGMVTMTMRPREDPLITAARRVDHDIRSAQDLALVSGAPQGLIIDETGYQRATWQNLAWTAVPGTAVAFTHNVAFRTNVSRSPTKPLPPEIILDTTGIAQGETLFLTRGRQTIEMEISPDGTVMWEDPNA
jgi:type II secretion system protein H